MLVMTQLAVGTLTAVVAAGDALDGAAQRLLATGALGALVGGLGASVLHLGRPRQAWRAFLGLRSSWMSREIVAFALLAPLAGVYVAGLWLAAPGAAAVRALGGSVVVAGVAAIACSAMIYHATGRAFWQGRHVMGRFAGSTALLGAIALLCVQPSWHVALGIVTLAMAKLAAEGAVLRHRRDPEWTELRRTALLMTGPLAWMTSARFACGVVGALVLPALAGVAGTPAAVGALVLCFAGELAERYLFFAAVAPARMPGSL
jgi:formate dehydrogenase iron-sulfur subunit